MAIAEDASTPAVVTGSNITSLTTASFSPPAGSLLVAVAAWGSNGMSSPSLAVSDSRSGTWTAGAFIQSDTYDYAATWYRYLTSAPGSMTVTVTGTGFTQASPVLAVRVLTGADSSQSGAASATASGTSTSVQGSITTTASGSWAYCAAVGYPVGTSGSAIFTTVTIEDYYPAETDVLCLAGRQGAATGTPGATTLGWTTSASGAFGWCAQEILPAPSPPPPNTYLPGGPQPAPGTPLGFENGTALDGLLAYARTPGSVPPPGTPQVVAILYETGVPGAQTCITEQAVIGPA